MNALESSTDSRGLPGQGIRFFTIEEVMFVFRVKSPSTIDDWKADGLPYFKKGRVVLFPAAGVLAWARRQTVNGAVLDGRPARPEELEAFWEHVERMVGVTVNQMLQELRHPNHLEAA